MGLRQTLATTKATTKSTAKAKYTAKITTKAKATAKGKKTAKKQTNKQSIKKKGKGKRKAVNAQSDETDGYVSSDAEPDVCPENITHPNDQHAALQNLATTVVDVSP